MASQEITLLIVISAIIFYTIKDSNAAITPTDETYTRAIGSDVSILWTYDNEADMDNIEWNYKSSSSPTPTLVMKKVGAAAATVYNSFNIEHVSDGSITLKAVTSDNVGIYYCTVAYSFPSTHASVTGTVTLSLTREKNNCFVLGNGRFVDTKHKCGGVWIGIGSGIYLLAFFVLGLAVGFILTKYGQKCCPWFYSDDCCEKCLIICCLFCVCINKLRLPSWSKVLGISVVMIPFAFGIWVALKCSKLRPPDKPCITLQSDTTRIMVHWEKPYNGGSQILSYRIICHRVTNNKEEILYTKETTYTIENLQPGTFYTVEVCARNIMGYSPPAKKDIQTKIDITLKKEGNDTNFGIETCNTPANMVESVTPGAARQGINERDTIVSINGESTEGKSYQEIKTLLTSPGDSITLTIEKGRNQTANGQKEMEELV